MAVAVVVAGGTGERFRASGGKQMAEVSGLPVLSHTLHAFLIAETVTDIVVVAPPERVEEYRRRVLPTGERSKRVRFVAGGETRQASVAAGLAVLDGPDDVVVIHDGARPLVTDALIDDAVRALLSEESAEGAVVGHPAYDTLKEGVTEDGGSPVVTGTIDRSRVWQVQTPQVFRLEALREAYSKAASEGFLGTDDASLIERAGGKVLLLPGPRHNLKVTVPEDLEVVEALLKARG